MSFVRSFQYNNLNEHNACISNLYRAKIRAGFSIVGKKAITLNGKIVVWNFIYSITTISVALTENKPNIMDVIV